MPADISGTAISGMSDRGRDGANTVTVTPATAAPGAVVKIKVETTVDVIGVLATVYSGTAQVGTHTPATGAQICMGNANAITHSAPFAVGTKSLEWDYTVPSDATGTLEARVVTLTGELSSGAMQKFGLGKAPITVSGGGAVTSTTSAGATTATTAAGSTTAPTVTASAASVAVAATTLAAAVFAMFA